MRLHGAYWKVTVTESSVAQRLEVEQGQWKDLTDASLTPRTFRRDPRWRTLCPGGLPTLSVKARRNIFGFAGHIPFQS